MTRRPWVLHPFLLAPLPILRLHARNLHSLPFGHVLVPTALALAAVGVLFGALRMARLDGPRAGLVASTALVLFFGFGRGVQAMVRLGVVGDRPIVDRMALAVESLAMAGVVIACLRVRPEVARTINVAVNAGSAAMVAFWLIGVVSETWGDPSSRPPTVAEPVAPPTTPRPARKPDVYYMVLDAYGRSDTLKEVHGFDNSRFLEHLERKGFFVARRSTSNYCQTALSIASTMNFRYLDDLAGSRSPSRLPLRDLIQENAVFKAFHRQGYKIVAFATGFDATEMTGADSYREPRSNLQPFEELLAEETPLWLLEGRRADHEPHRMHRERILEALDRWPAAGDARGAPIFCFAHILAPHPPFDFGADGRDTSSREGPYSLADSEAWRHSAGHGGPEEYEARYREQAGYITSRVERAVDEILAHHGPEDQPIIIIQGDHGPGSHFDSGADRPNDLRERMSILYAIYLPDGGRDRVDDSITPVNTFRVILDGYFGSKLGRLPDRNYYSPYLTPYRFTEVTAELAGASSQDR
jgi:hypothetical protein